MHADLSCNLLVNTVCKTWKNNLPTALLIDENNARCHDQVMYRMHQRSHDVLGHHVVCKVKNFQSYLLYKQTKIAKTFGREQYNSDNHALVQSYPLWVDSATGNNLSHRVFKNFFLYIFCISFSILHHLNSIIISYTVSCLSWISSLFCVIILYLILSVYFLNS